MLRRFLSKASKNWKPFVVIIFSFALIWAALQGYSADWTGFGNFTTPKGDFIRGKTLWDWMQLFLIPIFISVGVFYLNRFEREREHQRAEERSWLEREIAADRQREAVLQSYLDRMADLLLKEKLRATKKAEVRDVARIRTLTALRTLDSRRKGIVLRFLQESRLIEQRPVISLIGADLTKAELITANLCQTDLRNVDLSKSNLAGADLSKSILKDADLNEANLLQANLNGTDLTKANLTRASLNRANLVGANLSNANLYQADLSQANLSQTNLVRASLVRAKFGSSTVKIDGADLTDADLSNAEVSEEQLAHAKSLKGAIMPDGTKRE
jgi:uncharacterized protein YjbI with pentapeptide repeats